MGDADPDFGVAVEPVDEASRPAASELGDWFGWAIVELAPDGIMVMNEVGRILLANRRVEALFGYDREDLIGRRVELLVPERFRHVHLGHRLDYEAEPRPRPMGTGKEIWARRVDGSEFPVDISLSPVALSSGVRTIAVIRDGSRLHAAEEAAQKLLHLEARVRAATDLTNEAVQELHVAALRLTGLIGNTGHRDKIVLALGDLQSALTHIISAAFTTTHPSL